MSAHETTSKAMLRRLLTGLLTSIRTHVGPADVFAVVGYLATLYGIAQMHRPSAWVIGGLVPMVLGFVAADNPRRRR